jgi:predicted ABC-type ATPase
MSHREIFVLGGPNGAGKSTTARVLLPETLSIEQFVNADLIAQGLSPFAPQSSALEAGRLMLSRIHDFRSRGQSFAFSAIDSRVLRHACSGLEPAAMKPTTW